MKTAIADIQSVSGIIFSAPHFNAMQAGESARDYELRIWRERAYYDEKTGECFIHGRMFKRALDYTASQLKMQIEDRKGKRWRNVFKFGVFCPGHLMLGINKADLEAFELRIATQCGKYIPARKRFPIVPNWSGSIEFCVVNDLITEDVFRLHLEKAGEICGLGAHRPAHGYGSFGRFEVTKIVWHETQDKAA